MAKEKARPKAEAPPAQDTSDPRALERMKDLTRRIVQVPKGEVPPTRHPRPGREA